ncbi:MAG: D-2-hydroxyacid dehydrogenase [Anaerolineae bacterium]
MKLLVGPNQLGLEKALPNLAAQYPDIEMIHCPQPADLAAQIADAEIFVGWLTPGVFEAARALRWIQSPSSGVNMFLAVPGFAESEVLLTSARGTHGACLAEHAFALIFAFTRHLKEYILAQPQHRWTQAEHRGSMRELTGATMGIIGLGAIGQATARRAEAFGMHVIAVDMLPVSQPACVEHLAGLEGLDELLRASDYVVVAVPYTDQTHDMLCERELQLMKPSALLIGISRGGIISERALARALREGWIAGAGLDVFETEPLPADSALWNLPNLVITPHTAGGTQYEGEHVMEILRENLDRYLAGTLPLQNQVDKRRGF